MGRYKEEHAKKHGFPFIFLCTEKGRRKKPSAVCAIAAAALTAALFLSCESTPKTTAPDDTLSRDGKEETLIDLLNNGKTDELKARLSSEESVNQQNEQGQTLLHIAALKNDASLVGFLLAFDPDTELTDSNGDTPLSAAVNNGCYAAAAALAGSDAYIFPKNNAGMSVYRIAEGKGSVALHAIINGKTTAQQDAFGKTALHHAAENLNEEAAAIIIKEAGDFSVEDLSGKTPLAYVYEKPLDPAAPRMAAALLLAGAEPLYGDFSYFETAVLKRNLSMRFDEGKTPLHIAAEKGDDGFVDYLIANGAQINAKDSSSSTPLHEAVRNGKIQSATLLIQSGADVNVRDSAGNTPLHLVMPVNSRRPLFATLLQAGADPNIKDIYGETPLHITARITMEPDLISSLVNAGADLNERNKKGATPLSLAIERNQIQQANFFVRLGADIHAEDIDETTALTKALANGLEMTKAVIMEGNIQTRDSAGRTPLHIAVIEQAPAETIDYLISLGSDVNARDKNGNTPLHTAVTYNFRQTGEMLLAAGADVFYANVSGDSVLKIALTRLEGREEWILTSNVVKSSDGAGNTPLHLAAEWNIIPAVSIIMDKGGDINARNSNGETPLFNAVKTDSPEMVAALVSSGNGDNGGININARDFLGDSALYECIRWQASKAAAVLIDKDVRTNGKRLINAKNLAGKTALHEAARTGNTELLLMVLKAGADVNAIDETGRTPLADAVSAEDGSAIRILLSYGASPLMQDMYGRTPLHEAAESSGTDIITMLRTAGANPMSRDAYGKTPLSLAFSRSAEIINAVLDNNTVIADSDGNTPIHIAVEENADASILESLIARGYPLNNRNRNGVTALHLALKNGDETAMRVLLAAGADPFITDAEGDSVASVILGEKTDYTALLAEYAAGKTDATGDGLLHYAARLSSADIVRQLRKTQLIDPYAKNIEGETAADIAARWKRPDIQELLK